MAGAETSSCHGLRTWDSIVSVPSSVRRPCRCSSSLSGLTCFPYCCCRPLQLFSQRKNALMILQFIKDIHLTHNTSVLQLMHFPREAPHAYSLPCPLFTPPDPRPWLNPCWLGSGGVGRLPPDTGFVPCTPTATGAGAIVGGAVVGPIAAKETPAASYLPHIALRKAELAPPRDTTGFGAECTAGHGPGTAIGCGRACCIMREWRPACTAQQQKKTRE